MSSRSRAAALETGRRAQRGSTVVEAITLVLLIGIITRIAIPPMAYVMTRAQATQVRATFNQVQGAASRLSLENLPWPPDTAAGVVPTVLGQRLPRGFSFDRGNYQLDWQNWTLPAGLPSDPTVEGLIGVSVTTTDRSLGQALLEVIPLDAKFVLGDTYTFIFATR